ncbi:hypothetical protein [Actinocorallia sp. A-T 12471]|uniref:hypothetical protein n=1 Tax=Actinocorallia sp. A-T 12471 TaxID=3089813 RepID=UPI0029CBD268|nr:hypothetical protein [Actinocorallia sp. A-T 12471]MDX6742032.1 hypothetical protein [Actinocorallia sp. A-T 12471]
MRCLILRSVLGAALLGSACLSPANAAPAPEAPDPAKYSPLVQNLVYELLMQEGRIMTVQDCKQKLKTKSKKKHLPKCLAYAKDAAKWAKEHDAQVAQHLAEEKEKEKGKGKGKPVQVKALPAASTGGEDGTCSADTDTRGGKGFLRDVPSAVWSICVKTARHSHGSVRATCRGGALLWTARECAAHGRFTVRKDGEKVASGDFTGSANVPSDAGTLFLSDVFTFKCQGHGAYTFELTDLTFTVGSGGDAAGLSPGPHSITTTGC